MTDSPLPRAEDRARTAIERTMALSPDVRASIFTSFDAARIVDDARALDADAVRSGKPLAGLLVSIKDLFDEAGITTTAGSTILASEPAATRDADCLLYTSPSPRDA